MRLKWNFGTVMAVCGLLGAAVAGGWAYRVPDQYVSTAVLRAVPPEGMTEAQFAERLRQAQTNVLSRTSLTEIIQRRDLDLYRSDRTRIPMEAVVMGMRDRDVKIQRVTDAMNPAHTNAFVISFAYPDRDKAQQVTQQLLAAFMQQLPREGAWVKAEVLDPPTLPGSPARPSRMAYVAIGLVVGLGLGLVLLGARRWPVVVAAGVAAGVIAGAGSYLIPDRFVSTAVLRIDPASPELAPAVLTDERLIGMIQKPALDLYHDDRARKPMADVVAKMRHDLQITMVSANSFAVRYEYPNRYKAQAVVREVVSALVQANVTVSRQTGANGRHNLEVVSPAVLPEQPSWPNRLSIAVIGLAGGLVLGILLTVFRRRAPSALAASA
jgi:capsular polysaccharide biosynthesis protein